MTLSRHLGLMLALSLFTGAIAFAETESGLEAGFRTPPAEAKTQVLYDADSPLLPSGILGSVTLQAIAEVPLKPAASQ